MTEIKMKTKLTIEQSQRLIELGMNPQLASEIHPYCDDVSQWTNRGYPIFTIIDLLELLPKCITKCNAYLNIVGHPDEWWVGYENEIITLIGFASIEFIDALYELLCWVIENGYYQPTLSPTEK